MAAPLAPAEDAGLSSPAAKAAPMITKVEIENYKSIRKLTLELGRMNVFIGENGCGKSNILEAIALGSAASRDKLDNEFLIPRGIRVTKPELMRSAFEGVPTPLIEVAMSAGARRSEYRLMFYPSVGWINGNPGGRSEAILAGVLGGLIRQLGGEGRFNFVPGNAGLILGAVAAADPGVRDALSERIGAVTAIADFAIFCPENSILRRLEDDTPLHPVGARGEAVFQHLKELGESDGGGTIAEINEHLELLDWFERLEVPSRDMAGRALRIRDRYLAEGVVFDQKSANEGFLFLLFYLTLFISPHTPRFFAVDNVDASLNPKLCQALMASLVTLAKRHEKQAIVTTHNPSLLDGLDLHDDDQRLFVVSRDDDGATQIHRVPPPKPLGNEPPIRLSTAFMRGYIGGLPKNF